MNTCKTVNLCMVRGDTLAFAFEIEGIDSLDSCYFSCKVNGDDDNYVFQKSLEDGIELVETGKYRVRVAPADTENVEVGSYNYDLEIGANDDIYTVLKGTLIIEQDVTRG